MPVRAPHRHSSEANHSTRPQAPHVAKPKHKPRAKPANVDSIVYWGFNPLAPLEVKVMNRASKLDRPMTVIAAPPTGATSIEHDGVRYDLRNESHCSAFARALGAAEPQVLARTLLGITLGKRVEAAKFAVVMHEAHQGKRHMPRLAISAHSAVGRYWGDGTPVPIVDNGMWVKDVFTIISCFPKARDQIKHLLVSACSSGYVDNVEFYRQQLPNLETVVAWAGSSPATTRRRGVPTQLATWVRTTERDKASIVDADLFDADLNFSGRNVVTWNKKDGYQGPTYAQAKTVLDRFGGNVPEKKPALDMFYFASMAVIQHPDFEHVSEAEQDRYKDKCIDALVARHPELALGRALLRASI